MPGGLQRAPAMDGAPHVFLVPQALLPHGGHIRRMRRHQPVQGLALPEGVIGGMVFGPPGIGILIQPMLAGPGSRRAGAQEAVIIVIDFARAGMAFAPGAGLAGGEVHAALAIGAIVKPVIAHPAIDHRAFGRRHFQGGMGVQQRHHHRETLIGRPHHADPAVAFGHMPDQPVDGVPGVGGFIGVGGIERPRAPDGSSRTCLRNRICRACPGRRGYSRHRSEAGRYAPGRRRGRGLSSAAARRAAL